MPEEEILTDEESTEESWFDQFIPKIEDNQNDKKVGYAKTKKGVVGDQFEERIVRHSGAELKNGFREKREIVKVKPSKTQQDES